MFFVLLSRQAKHPYMELFFLSTLEKYTLQKACAIKDVWIEFTILFCCTDLAYFSWSLKHALMSIDKVLWSIEHARLIIGHIRWTMDHVPWTILGTWNMCYKP